PKLGEDDPKNSAVLVPSRRIRFSPRCISSLNDSVQNLPLTASSCRVFCVEEQKKKFPARALRSLSFETEHREKKIFRQYSLHQSRRIEMRPRSCMQHIPAVARRRVVLCAGVL